MVRLIFISLLFALFSGPLYSESAVIPGQETPEFKLAVKDWLDGDDLVALKNLAKLSREDNRAAQILLAQISTRATMHAHVTAPLERKDRIALLRKPGGLSGKSWLDEAEKDQPLAIALSQSKRIGEKEAAITALFKLGEPQTALIATRSMLHQGEVDAVIRILENAKDTLPEEAVMVLAEAKSWRRGISLDVFVSRLNPADRTRFERSRLSWFGIAPRDLITDLNKKGAALDLAVEVTAWIPVRLFCETHCAETVKECTLIGAASVLGAGPMPMRSPLESVVSNEHYWSSPRIVGDLARSIDNLDTYTRGGIYKIDACFVDSMKATQSMYGFRK